MLSRVNLCLGAAAVAATVTMSAGAFAATVDLSFDRFERSGLATANTASPTKTARMPACPRGPVT